MFQAVLQLSLFGPILVSGTITCTGSNWVLDGSKCYKIIPGSPEDGQAQCTNDYSSAALMLAPTSQAATNVGSIFSGEKIWTGLRFSYGEKWIWNDGSTGTVTWGSEAILPQLCIMVGDSGFLYDYFCYKTLALICQMDIDGSGLCESGWTKVLSKCYKKLRHDSVGVTFNSARQICSDEYAYIMTPQSLSEAQIITSYTVLDFGSGCWLGITDFDADHTYTWEDGTEINESSLYFKSDQPSHRNLDYICAYIQNGLYYNAECTKKEKVVCVIDAIDNLPTTDPNTISTQNQDTSADMKTTEHTVTTNPTTMAEVSSSDSTIALNTATEETERNTDDIIKTKSKLVGQFYNATTISSTFLVPAIPVSGIDCIDKCTNYCSTIINGNADASKLSLFKVDTKSLSSFRRSHQSAVDSRMSSFYIGCVGSAILIIFVLFIVMLDFLPRA